MLITVG